MALGPAGHFEEADQWSSGSDGYSGRCQKVSNDH